MEKEEFVEKVMDIRMKIAFLPHDEKNNPNHLLYQELQNLKKKYTRSLLKERERELYDEHKRK